MPRPFLAISHGELAVSCQRQRQQRKHNNAQTEFISCNSTQFIPSCFSHTGAYPVRRAVSIKEIEWRSFSPQIWAPLLRHVLAHSMRLKRLSAFMVLFSRSVDICLSGSSITEVEFNIQYHGTFPKHAFRTWQSDICFKLIYEELCQPKANWNHPFCLMHFAQYALRQTVTFILSSAGSAPKPLPL